MKFHSVYCHRIIKWLRVDGISGGHVVCSYSSRATLHQVAQDHIQAFFKISNEETLQTLGTACDGEKSLA